MTIQQTTQPANQQSNDIANMTLPKGVVSLAKHITALPKGNYVILVQRNSSDSGVTFDIMAPHRQNRQ